MPPDVRRQIERAVKDGQKTLRTAIDQLETQVRRTAKQADMDKALKRLTDQVQQLARAASSRGAATAASTRRRAAGATRRAATTTKRVARSTKRNAAPARKPAARKPAAKATPTRAASTTRRAAPRRSTGRRSSSASPEVRSVPEPPAPGPMPERVDMDDSST
ncbi:MAG: hypothetical protein ABI455_01155 [Candidatus Dormiibacterota bacterium]